MQGYFLFILLCCFSCFSAIAQPAMREKRQSSGATYEEPTIHKYYLLIEGIRSPDDVKAIAAKVMDQPGVLQFAIDDYPVSYFIIRSEGRITEAEFRKWIDGLPYTIVQMEGDDLLRLEEMLTPLFRKKRQDH